jgi:hypothetical protein
VDYRFMRRIAARLTVGAAARAAAEPVYAEDQVALPPAIG